VFGQVINALFVRNTQQDGVTQDYVPSGWTNCDEYLQRLTNF